MAGTGDERGDRRPPVARCMARTSPPAPTPTSTARATIVARVRRQAGDLCGVPAPPGDLRAAADARTGCRRSRPARGTVVRHRRDAPGRRLGRRRRADRLHHRQPDAACRTWRRSCCRSSGPPCVAAHNAYQMCLALPKVVVPGDGGAALRRGRDAGDDGLCRRGRQRRGAGARARRASSATPTTARRIGSARRAAWARCRIR